MGRPRLMPDQMQHLVAFCDQPFVEHLIQYVRTLMPWFSIMFSAFARVTKSLRN
jgi:hypothetical protein